VLLIACVAPPRAAYAEEAPSPSPDTGPAAQPLPPAIEAASAPAPEPPKAPTGYSTGGFVDLNLYPYLVKVDADSVVTINTLVKLPYGFSYFGMLNINNEANRKALFDTDSYYFEQNLRWAIPEAPLDLTIQHNPRSGHDNDRLRLGVLVRLHDIPYLGPFLQKIAFNYAINFHVVQFDHEDNYVWQMEHIARLGFPYLDDRLYIAGFADHTFNMEAPPNVRKNPVVMEVQAGVRLFRQLYAVTEYRINDFRPNQRWNLAFGAEYAFKW